MLEMRVVLGIWKN